MKLNLCKRKAALSRLERIKATTDIIERLAGHRGAKTFMVDTEGLKVVPPHIIVTERFSLLKLNYARCIASICEYHKRKFEIVFKDDCLTYIIY